jgi:hypothetical protein
MQQKPMTVGLAVYLRHIAAGCIAIAEECPDEATAEKLRNLSIELAEKADRVEKLFDVMNDEDE